MEGDPPAVELFNVSGTARFLLIADHAGNRVPAALGDLGLPAAERERHIGWDIGIAALGRTLATRIDAPFVAQTYSRLVIDCNRDPAAPDAIPSTSDGTAIPANAALSEADRAARVAAIHEPYQRAVATALARRPDAALIALHSFTPALRGGETRPWQIGVLHNGADDGLARALLGWLRDRGDLTVGDNEPYAMDGIDYTVPRHAFAAGRRYAEIEIRQDLLAADVAGWAALLAEAMVALP